MHMCPECQVELEHDDTFGNSAYVLQVIGCHAEGQAIKKGDIYKCPECGNDYHTFDSDPTELHHGYPC